MHSGERAWKVYEGLTMGVDRVRKIRDRKQRTDIGKYSFVNMAIKNWEQLSAGTLGTFLL
jgi:hypothetical protein